MKNLLKIILGCLGLLVIGIGLFVGILFVVFRPDLMCGNHFIESKLKLECLVFSVDCGAASDYSTHISIVKSNYILVKNEKGNVFVADSDHGNAEMNGKIIKLQIEWIDDKNIVIQYHKNARVFKDKKLEKGVNIVYKEIFLPAVLF